MATEKLRGAKLRRALVTDGLHGDGGNLWLQTSNGGAGRSWVFRWTDPATKCERYMGLGPLHTVNIDMARDLARTYRQQVRARKDPQRERDGAKLDAEMAAGRVKTFCEVFDEWCETKLSKRSPHTLKATRVIKCYVLPHIGAMPIQKVDTDIILDTVGLRRLWVEKNPTAVHLHSFLKRIFSYAIAMKYYVGENPAAWRDHLEHALLPSKDVHKVTHMPCLAYRDAGLFMQMLRAYEDRSFRAMGHPTVALWLEFVVLTGVRISEVRLATWSEINEKDMVWEVPPEHRKIGRITDKPHLVPITKAMWAVLEEMKRRNPDRTPDSLIFPSPRGGGNRGGNWTGTGQAFEVNTVARFIRESLKWETEITPHGFRSTLTDWCLAQKVWPDKFIALQVGHLPPGKVRQAYERDQMVNERRPMMEAWGEYCSRPAPEPIEGSNISLLAEQRGKRRIGS
jgi:integrase